MSEQMLPQRPLPDGLVLFHGPHSDASQGMCVMEAVAYVAGEQHSDSPHCTSPTIAAFLRSWNDSIRTNADRTLLLGGLVTRLVGTRSTPEVELHRSYLAFDWLVRANLPAWMDLTHSLAPHAAALRSLVPLVTADAVRAATVTIQKSKNASDAAWDTAWNTAWGAAGNTVWNTAWDAAMAATGAAGGMAAGSASGATAITAAWDAAWDAAKGLVVRDIIGSHGFTQAHYDTLTGVWATVIGPAHPADADRRTP